MCLLSSVLMRSKVFCVHMRRRNLSSVHMSNVSSVPMRSKVSCVPCRHEE